LGEQPANVVVGNRNIGQRHFNQVRVRVNSGALFALVILPRTTWVRAPRSTPSFSAMTITSCNLLERAATRPCITACRKRSFVQFNNIAAIPAPTSNQP
jgi:hypothetical protein